MSNAITEAQESTKVAEQALRALWMFDVTAFESCRCACCGGLRDSIRLLTSSQATVDQSEPRKVGP